jgi:hypothetical protein
MHTWHSKFQEGVITVQGSFQVSNTFDMTAEYARLKGETDHNVLPDVG